MNSFSIDRKKNPVFIVIWILTACAIFAPLLLTSMQHRVSEISETGIFGGKLRTSVVLKIFEGVSIGSTLPSLVNIFLDKISNASDKSELGTHYFSLLVMFATGIVYLSCYEEDFTPYFYASSFCVKLQTLCSVVMYSVSNGVIAAEHKLHSLMFISPTLCFATLQVVISFSLLFPTSEFLTAARIPTYCISVIVFFTCEFVWFYKFWCHCRSNNYNLEFEAKKEAIHMSTLWIFAIVFMVVNSFDNPSENVWVDTKEWILVVYCALYVAASIVLTIVPNRLLRTISDIQEAALKLKREFVRYVSHEIRSPLNVAFAGLEILKAELEVVGVTTFVSELLDDIHFASTTAIEILNDMLQYEYIDSGTFKLDMAVVPLVEAFKGRLGAYRFMASKKNISLLIEDHVQVSEFYVPDDSIELLNNLSKEDDDDDSNSMYLVLYIDKFRVEQIIRNLVSNAIKFTPEGGNITMRFIHTTVAGFDPSEAKHPVHDLQDDLLVKKVEGYLRVEVVDNGAGIAIENQSRMFNEFTQFNRNSLQGGGGSGLGLWICKNLAALHGGKISFYSDGEGKGCTFYVEFPYYNKRKNVFPSPMAEVGDGGGGGLAESSSTTAKNNLLAMASYTSLAMITPTSSRVFPKLMLYSSNTLSGTGPDAVAGVADLEMGIAQKPQILIVDDSSANRKIVRRLVESRVNAVAFGECTVLEADDGRSALQLMRSEMGAGRSIQIVLIDYIMFHMNGPEAVQKMRAELDYKGIIIGITGNALPEDIAYFKDHGADDVITKPLTNAKLMDALFAANKLSSYMEKEGEYHGIT